MKKLEVVLVVLLVAVVALWASGSWQDDPPPVLAKPRPKPVACRHRFTSRSSTPSSCDIFLECRDCGLKRPYDHQVQEYIEPIKDVKKRNGSNPVFVQNSHHVRK